MTTTCITLMSWGLGLFAALVLLAWLDERSDAYCGLLLGPWGGLANNYQERLARQHDVIETTCAYCRTRTRSVYCPPCRVYVCTRHNMRAHRDCGPS